MRYHPEPQHIHGTVAGTAILLVNLGTPEAPTKQALKRYLRQFLSDPRVVEIPRPVWWLILNGIILALRPRVSARKYARIWTNEGSPLKVHTERQTKLLAGYLGERLHAPLMIEYAMRYGEPAVDATLQKLKAAGAERILVLPLYPQYAASTTGSVYDEVAAFLERTRNAPEIRLVKHFHDHPAYIQALANAVREHWQAHGKPDKLLMSFHGLPRYTLEKGDPYHCECQKTARLLAQALELPDNCWQVTFQSRFGRAEWLSPYTAATLDEYGRKGVKRVDVICPSFVSDCLETLEEIGIAGKETFLAAGGRGFHLIACLNERDDWLRALSRIAESHLGGWITDEHDASAVRESARAGAARAKALGAPR